MLGLEQALAFLLFLFETSVSGLKFLDQVVDHFLHLDRTIIVSIAELLDHIHVRLDFLGNGFNTSIRARLGISFVALDHLPEVSVFQFQSIQFRMLFL